jgi:hypothetical protein
MLPKPTNSAPQRRERHNFNMSPDLKELLLESRKGTGNTMNGEIHERLEATFNEPTQRLAAAIWPMMQKLEPSDREKFVEFIATMARDQS